MFYWDEDTYIGQAENYDAKGKIYRIIYNVLYPFFEAPGAMADAGIR